MKKIRNRIIPFRGFKAMSFWPFIFIRRECSFDEVDERHERIHGCQQVEMFITGVIVSVIFFLWDCGWWSLLGLPLYYWWYLFEWTIRQFTSDDAYRDISYEQEAYKHEKDKDYLATRKPFAWLIYI